MDRPLRIGTRGSPLALAQANMVAASLKAAHGWEDERIEIVPITTTGDVIQDRPLAEVGGKGLWTKELDRCLSDGRTDISVHSMKDVETIRPSELLIVAMLPRADVCDRLIGAEDLAQLPAGARIGTSSPRRSAQI
ncbi:MAG TPA: hydroxymethylbilane synthase, partial [Allosphingosinicella sp.]|nr:hydroxymethylbilane synthase [Allosphingosinicella sp.]